MRFSSLLPVGLLSACSAAVFPPPVVPTHPKATDWPDVGAVVLEDVTVLDYRFHSSGAGADAVVPVVVVASHRRRIKVLSEAGLRFAKVTLPVDELTSVTNIYARSVHPGGNVVDMSPSAVRAASVTATDSPVREVTFTVPGAAVGGLIEYRYDRAFSDADFVPPQLFGTPMPSLRTEIRYLVAPGIELELTAGNGTQPVDRTPVRVAGVDRDTYIFVETDLAPVYAEEHMPHPARVAPWVAAQVVRTKPASGEGRRLETWDDVGRRLEALLALVRAPVGQGDVVQRFEHVRDRINVVPRLNLGVLSPASADAVMSGAPSCTRDAAAVLLGALQGSGVQVSPAYFSTPSAPTFQRGSPSVQAFDRAGVAVLLDRALEGHPLCKSATSNWLPVCRAKAGDLIFLYPACKECAFSELPADMYPGLAFVPGIPSAQWTMLSLEPGPKERMRLSYELSFDYKAKLAGKLDGSAVGVSAQHVRRALREGRPSELVLAEMAWRGKGDIALRNPRLTGVSQLDAPVTFSGSVESRVEKLGYERFRMRPSDLAGYSLPVLARPHRKYPRLFGAPMIVEVRAELDLPVGYDVDLPEPVRIEHPMLAYQASFKRRQRVLVYERKLERRVEEVAIDAWRTYLDLYERVRAAEDAGISITVRDSVERE